MSVHREPSQVRPNAYYRVNSGSSYLVNEAGANIGSAALASGAILMDMGKTLYPDNGNILRKVKLMDNATSGLHEGYIFLYKPSGVAADISAL